MDPKGQISEAQQAKIDTSQAIEEQHKCSAPRSQSICDSDSSFSLAEGGRVNNFLPQHSSNEHEITRKRRGKHGLKYAKITNEQREQLIKQVTSTGCTIKSAAQKLGINFSTAKAIMQIFKKEGRSQKKVIRKNKKRIFFQSKRLQVQTNDTNSQNEEIRPTQKHSPKIPDQVANTIKMIPINDLQNQNTHQQVLIQQLTTQNLQFQNQIQTLCQENMLISTNYQQLLQQYTQLQTLIQQILVTTKGSNAINPFLF